MKTKFTKGEWIIENRENNLYSMVYSESGKRIAEVKSYGKSDYFNDPSIEERIANAKLIAAAPDLLEALINLLAEFEGDIEDAVRVSSENIGTVIAAKNSIKKATE